jgi:hypothetical protein
VIDDGVEGYNDHGIDDWDRVSDREHGYNAPRCRNKLTGMLCSIKGLKCDLMTFKICR